MIIKRCKDCGGHYMSWRNHAVGDRHWKLVTGEMKSLSGEKL